MRHGMLRYRFETALQLIVVAAILVATTWVHLIASEFADLLIDAARQQTWLARRVLFPLGLSIGFAIGFFMAFSTVCWPLALMNLKRWWSEDPDPEMRATLLLSVLPFVVLGVLVSVFGVPGADVGERAGLMLWVAGGQVAGALSGALLWLFWYWTREDKT